MGNCNAVLLLAFLASSLQLSTGEEGGMCGLDAPKGRCASEGGEEAHHYRKDANVHGKTSDDVAKPETSEAAEKRDGQTATPYWEGKPTIHLGCVVCNDRAPEALSMLKSALMFSTSPVRYHIFVEDNLRGGMALEIDSWLDVRAGRVKYSMYKVKYPDGENQVDWRKLFKPCATMRLFIPTNTAKKLDAIIYLDTDTLVVSPLENLWGHFSRFNATQLAAMTPEGEDPNTGWYNRFALHPYYGSIGVNSGVMPMNLTRIRSLGASNKQGAWREEMVEIYHKYRYNLTWGDQDILNIYFHRHPERLYVYPCKWNYRPDHCMYMSNCESAIKDGCKVLHGNRGSFHDNRQMAFRAVYEAFGTHASTNDISTDLLTEIQRRFKDLRSAGCGEVRQLIFDSVKKSIKRIQKAKLQA